MHRWILDVVYGSDNIRTDIKYLDPPAINMNVCESLLLYIIPNPSGISEYLRIPQLRLQLFYIYECRGTDNM